MGQSKHLQVGYVCRAHGLAGEVAVKTFDPASESLFEVSEILLRLKDGSSATYQIESSRAANREILLVLTGVEDRRTAESLVGSTVFAAREDLGELEEGQYFLGDLVGLSAQDESGQSLGEVAEVWESGPVPNLVIRGGSVGELLVPFVDEFVPSVDLEGRKVVIRPPEYLE